MQINLVGTKKVLPRFELGLPDSESGALAVTPQVLTPKAGICGVLTLDSATQTHATYRGRTCDLEVNSLTL